MAISAERDQIFVCVVTLPAARANVVDLEVIGNPAVNLVVREWPKRRAEFQPYPRFLSQFTLKASAT
jgi:hypothetical protein